jgi:hypothetical protein
MTTKKINKNMFEPGKIKTAFFAAILFCGLILINSACESAPSMRANTATPLPEAQEKLTSLQTEVRDMENANFQFIYVFKRKDAGVFDKEDKQYLRANKPADVNRFVLTSDEKAFVAGSNYPFSQENLEALQKRFTVENFSKPIAQVNVSANENTNANAANQKP